MLEDEDFEDMESGEASVIHTGLKQILPRYVKIAPGKTAYVKKASQVPWDDMILRCANCLGTGHLRSPATKRRSVLSAKKQDTWRENARNATTANDTVTRQQSVAGRFTGDPQRK